MEAVTHTRTIGLKNFTVDIALKTSQEEADTRILLHAKYASSYKSIILVADDTEMLLLCL